MHLGSRIAALASSAALAGGFGVSSEGLLRFVDVHGMDARSGVH
jgi:hypothetical protein